MMMAHRERVTRAIEHTGPDRIPIYHCPFPGTLTKYGQKLVVDVLNPQHHIMGNAGDESSRW